MQQAFGSLSSADLERARLEARDMLVEPLPNKALIRDLVTEIAPPDERLQAHS